MKRKDKLILALACFFVSAGQLRANYIGRVGIDADVCSKAGRELRPSAGESPVEYTLRNDTASSHDAAREIPNGPTILSTAKAWEPSAKLLDAIRQVESSGNHKAIGDNGAARGPYQCHRAYWTDAAPAVAKRYGECPKYEDGAHSELWSRRIVIAWMQRYAYGQSDEVVARRHNGGVRGERVKQTEKYWVKVRREMDKSK
jgi:hypothetical protein